MTFQVRCWLLLAITIAACSRGTPGLPDAEPGLHDAASAPDAPIPDTALANDQGVTADGPRPDSGIAPSCLRMPDAFPPSSCPATYAETRSWDCGSCVACGCTCHRCEGYDVWIHTFGYGDTRGCLYDPANGKLVGGRWGTDTTFQDCWFLYWGAAATIPQGCFTSSTTPGCAPADAGRD